MTIYEHNYILTKPPFYRCACGAEATMIGSKLRETNITDGYQWWSKECAKCHKPTMQVVRPGKVQCSECG